MSKQNKLRRIILDLDDLIEDVDSEDAKRLREANDLLKEIYIYD